VTWRFEELKGFPIEDVVEGAKRLIRIHRSSKFPTHAVMVAAIKEAKTTQPDRMIEVECDHCEGFGWLFWRRDTGTVSILCGCENSPAWAKEEAWMNNKPAAYREKRMKSNRDKPVDRNEDESKRDKEAGNWSAWTWVYKQLIDGGHAKPEEITNNSGRKMSETKEEHAARAKPDHEDIRKRKPWIFDELKSGRYKGVVPF